MQGVILAAGRGSRLYPHTRNRSKAMMPIVGKPIVQRVIEDIAASGVEDFVVVVSPDDREIIPHFRHRAKLAVNVRFVHQPQPLGMADALSHAVPLISGDFVLSASDNLVAEADIRRMLNVWRDSPPMDGLLAIMPVAPEEVSAVGVVEIDGNRITGIVEKPQLREAPTHIASLSLYCFSKTLVQYLTKVPLSLRRERELQDAIQMMIEEGGRVRGHLVGHRLTLNTPGDLLAINRYYLAGNRGPPVGLPAAVGPNTELVEPLRIEGDTVIGADCIVGPDVFIETGCRIGNGVTLRDSVVLRGSYLADGQHIVGAVISRDGDGITHR